MINPNYRLFAQSGCTTSPFTTIYWNILDWDSRRWIRAEGPSEPFDDDSEGILICEAVLPLIDGIDPSTTKMYLAADGRLLEVSTDKEDDCTPLYQYPLFTKEVVGEDAKLTIEFSQLIEHDRLSPAVDLVSTKASAEKADLLVFKYEMVPAGGTNGLWQEAFLTQRLRTCRYVVPFHRFVIDDSRFVGFTTKFMNNQDLLKLDRPFRKIWLEQLMEAVDEINIKHGTFHQDIAPRNIMIDPNTDNVCLVDFGRAALFGTNSQQQWLNDVDGVIFSLYEILTLDESFRAGLNPHEWRIDDVTSLEHWPVQVELEEGLTVEDLRSSLMGWATHRRQRDTSQDFKFREAWDFPEMPPTEEFSLFPPLPNGDTHPEGPEESLSTTETHTAEVAMEALKTQYNARWRRAPSSKLVAQRDIR